MLVSSHPFVCVFRCSAGEKGFTMFENVILFTVVWCAVLVAVTSQGQEVFIKPLQIIQCEERAKDEPVNQTLAAEACMRTYFVERLSANVMDQDDRDFFEQEFVNKTFGKKPPTSGYRVRRDIRVLNVTERHKLYNAFNALYRNGTLARFGRLHATEVYQKHHGAAFLPWHRVYISALEEKLREVDPEVSLPYWDYSMDYYMPLPSESVVWSNCFFGNGKGTVLDGPFRSMYGGYNTPMSRDIAASECPSRLINKEDIEELMKFCNFANITTGKNLYQDNSSQNLEKLHDSVHDWVGGDMGHLGTAAYDPVFFMHHAFIDYIWEQFRRRQSSNECQVDVEKDYRELGDYSVDDRGKQGPNDTMQGFEHLKMSDGLWKNWTTDVYGYENAPECPKCGNSDFLYCDMSINPNRPNGVCVPKTNDSCDNTSFMAFNRDEPYKKQQAGGATLSLGPRHLGLPGDGRTRFMSREEGLALLKQQLALGMEDMPRTSRPETRASLDTTNTIIISTLSSVLGILLIVVVTLVVYIRKLTRKLQSPLNERRTEAPDTAETSADQGAGNFGSTRDVNIELRQRV
ncbi:hypothetical protein DPMN_101724 [Dreissena polymorpha]|uniref:Tyrosinase copper-binding domain-containing protein n=1 Tax=Dreissena polymorpha TaxID=45954 RepID=A0A9D4LKF8_DREPO|nr:hypothetical protein DPMN_101724 [Dreissena polymorpha]